MTSKKVYQWTNLTSPELDQIASPDAVALMVLGAIEQHGPHLPLATDLIIGDGLRDELLTHLDSDPDVFVLPSLAHGASLEHASFNGTLSLPPELVGRIIESVGESIAASGIQRLVLLNAHGGNHATIDSAALNLRKSCGLLVVKANYMRLPAPDDVLDAQELREGLHGGLAETAMMLHLAPELVRREHLQHFPMREHALDHDRLIRPAGRAPWAWLAEDLNPQGVVGHADQATAEIGKRLIEHYGKLLARIVHQTAAMEWSPD